MFALFGVGGLWGADVADAAAVPGDPAADGGSEAEVTVHGFQPVDLADQLGLDPQDHGSFPFPGVPHLLLNQIVACFPWPLTAVPVSGEQEQQIVSLAITLPKFEDCLPPGNDVAAVAVQKDDTFESVREEILGECIQEIEIDSGGADIVPAKSM